MESSDETRTPWALNLDEIIEHIFKFMPMKELHSVARVSKKWRDVAFQAKASRDQLAWVLYENRRTSGLHAQIGKHMEVLASKPSVALLFCSMKLYEKPVAVNKGDRKRESILLTSYLKRVLPPSCRLLGVATDGVIGTSFDMSSILELENSRAASLLMLPEWKGIDIRSFELSDATVPANWNAGDDEVNTNGRLTTVPRLTFDDVDAVTRIPSDSNVRLILLFLTDSTNAFDSEFAGALVRRYGRQNTVVAGGYGYELLTDELRTRNRTSMPSGLGIAFCGDRLRVSSVVLHAEVSEPDDVKRYLKRLDVPMMDKRNLSRSFCLVCACMGRGRTFYDGADCVESKAFKELYPGIPLLGFFGGGEIGYDFPASSASAGDNSESKFRLFHSYSSIFVLLTYV